MDPFVVRNMKYLYIIVTQFCCQHCGMESLGADLFGQLSADRVYLESFPNLKWVACFLPPPSPWWKSLWTTGERPSFSYIFSTDIFIQWQQLRIEYFLYRSLDPELLAGPMSDHVRVIHISKNPLLEVADLRLFENVKRTDLMVTMIENNIKTVTPPSKPSNIYSLNLGRNAIASVTGDMLRNLLGVKYLYFYEVRIFFFEYFIVIRQSAL